MTAKIIETLRVRFVNSERYEMHKVLVAAGFSFTVHPDLTVGDWYEHKKKLIGVEIKESDDFVTHNLKYKEGAPERIFDSTSYSKQEWAWMTEIDVNETVLERELHILLNVRPRFFTPPQALSHET